MLTFEPNFQSVIIPRTEPQLKKHEKLLIFVKKCNNFATFSKEICQSWYIETSYDRKYWLFGKLLQIFQKKIFQFWHFETQYIKKYWLFEQNTCRLALVMPFRVSLSKKVNFSFWRVLVTVDPGLWQRGCKRLRWWRVTRLFGPFFNFAPFLRSSSLFPVGNSF